MRSEEFYSIPSIPTQFNSTEPNSNDVTISQEATESTLSRNNIKKEEESKPSNEIVNVVIPVYNPCNM